MPDSRSILLAAAAEEFAKHGLHGTRIQAIVSRAGINERMIYHHFGSKQGLYTAVLHDQRVGVGAAWRPILDKAAAQDPYTGMRMALTSLFDILLARPLLLALLLHEALAQSRTLALPTAELLPASLRELYEAGQREGVFRRDCPFEVAYATAIGALFALTVFAPPLADDLTTAASGMPALRDQVVGQLMDGMTGPTSPEPERRLSNHVTAH
ncbi:MAG TPA: TetR/AcrR family transcriptional regulator [Actinomycetes bacterium]|jgi:AcrR family transcriptional regulator|nr:TetR/AcrR family transcriptional regulator [Actinomycetes bacterium]